MSNSEILLLQSNLQSVVTAKKKKSAYTFDVKDAVYKAVKRDGMSWHMPPLYSEYPEGNQQSRQLFWVGPMICWWDFSAADYFTLMFQLETTVMKAMLQRRLNLTVSILVIQCI